MQNILDDLMIKYGSDKGCNRNNYCRYYYDHFIQKFDVFTNVLEIGVQNGYSIKAWRDFFPSANIHGIDILESCKQFHYPGKNIFIHIGDQTDKIFLNSVGSTNGPFDVIVDDGSHVCSHVITSFKEMWKHVKPGGYYVIEDLGVCTNVGKYIKAHQDLGEYTTIDYLHELQREIDAWGMNVGKNMIAKEIESMLFGRWICFLKKKSI